MNISRKSVDKLNFFKIWQGRSVLYLKTYLVVFSPVSLQPYLDLDRLSVEVSKSHAFLHTILDRSPLDEWSARRRDLYLRTHDTHNTDRHPWAPAEFEPAIPASERPQKHALDRAAGGIGWHMYCTVLTWQYITEFFLKSEIFQAKVVEKIKIHTLSSMLPFFSKILTFIKWT